MKRAFLTAMLLSVLMPGSVYSNQVAPASAESASLQTVSDAPRKSGKFFKGDFSKLIFLAGIFKKSHFDILYNGRTYKPKDIALLISAYIRMNYKNEKAEDWIEKYAYRSPSKGKIIYLRDPQGKILPLRDVLLQELKTLPA